MRRSDIRHVETILSNKLQIWHSNYKKFLVFVFLVFFGKCQSHRVFFTSLGNTLWKNGRRIPRTPLAETSRGKVNGGVVQWLLSFEGICNSLQVITGAMLEPRLRETRHIKKYT
jgi:hypothetical protein